MVERRLLGCQLSPPPERTYIIGAPMATVYDYLTGLKLARGRPIVDHDAQEA